MKNLMVLTFALVLLCGNYLLADEKIGGKLRPDNPKLVKLPVAWPNGDEATMVIYKGRPMMFSSYRKIGGGEKEMYLTVEDLVSSDETPHFGKGFGFACAFVKGKELNVFATETPGEDWPRDWTTDVYRFWTTDLKTWKKEMVLPRIGDKHILNTSVCKDPRGGYLMAYETDGPTHWETHLATSKDLSKWERIEDLEFTGVVFACPTIRYAAPYYYLMCCMWRTTSPTGEYEYRLGSSKYLTVLFRSKDLVTWELSPTKYPMLEPTAKEGGINNTDADIFEYQGNTYVYYITGDQQSWGAGRIALYKGSMKECLEAHFPKNTPMVKYDAKKAEFTYPSKK